MDAANQDKICPIACKRDVNDDVPLEVHQIHCKYRLVNCADISCKKKIIAKDFLQHFSLTSGDTHQLGQEFYSMIDTFTEGLSCLGTFPMPSCRITSSTRIQLPIFPKACIRSGFNFYLVGMIQDGKIYIWFFTNGNKDEAKKFEYSMMLDTYDNLLDEADFQRGNSAEPVDIAFRYRGKVHAVDEDYSGIIRNNDCFVIPYENAKRFIGKQLIVLILTHYLGDSPRRSNA